MKNNEEMYQSVLSGRNAYREKKNKRISIIKCTVPVLSCFCVAAVIGISLRDHPEKPSRTPEQSGIFANTTAESTSACNTSDSSTTVQITMKNASVTLPSSAANTHTTTAKSTVTNISHTTETDADDYVYSGNVNETSETNAATSKPVHTKTTVRTESRTTSRTTSATAVTKTTETKSPIATAAPIQPTVQPVFFYDIDSVAEAVRSFVPSTDTAVVSAESVSEKIYSQMYTKIKNDGCIFAVSENEAVSLRDDLGFYIFPNAQYEDIGIGGYAEYNDVLYHVTFYYADSNTFDNTNGIAEYLQKRMGCRCDEELDVSGQTVSICYCDDGRIYATFFIDKQHYVDVVSAVSKDEMSVFLNMLEYETIYF